MDSESCGAQVLGVPPTDPYDELAFVEIDTTGGIPPALLRAACAHHGDAIVVSSISRLGVFAEVIRYRHPPRE